MAQWNATLAEGADALAVAYAPNTLSLICSAAFPPGKPIALELALAERSLSLQGKSAGSKRRPDGRYDVRLRLVSLRREQREQLEQAFA